jgi:hypothetical protein
MMSVHLGVPSPENALRIYEFLMTYALAWRQTGGLGIGLTGPGGSLVLTLPLIAVDLTAGRLATIVANLARRAVTLKGLIAAGATERTEGLADSFLMQDNMIRI